MRGGRARRVAAGAAATRKKGVARTEDRCVRRRCAARAEAPIFGESEPPRAPRERCVRFARVPSVTTVTESDARHASAIPRHRDTDRGHSRQEPRARTAARRTTTTKTTNTFENTKKKGFGRQKSLATLATARTRVGYIHIAPSKPRLTLCCVPPTPPPRARRAGSCRP